MLSNSIKYTTQNEKKKLCEDVKLPQRNVTLENDNQEMDNELTSYRYSSGIAVASIYQDVKFQYQYHIISLSTGCLWNNRGDHIWPVFMSQCWMLGTGIFKFIKKEIHIEYSFQESPHKSRSVQNQNGRICSDMMQNCK